MKEKSDYYLIKVLLVGDIATGKTSIVTRFVDNTFYIDYSSTIGVDFNVKRMNILDKNFKLQIWNTAGDKRFRTIITSYYRGKNCVIITFDTTNKNSFHNISQWIREVKNYSSDDVDIILVGTKTDLIDKRIITYKEAKEYADRLGLVYVETSSRNNLNIEKLFNLLCTRQLEKIKLRGDIPKNEDYVINLNDLDNSLNSSSHKFGCC